MEATTKTRKRKSAPRVDAYEAVTAKIIAALEGGTVPWQKPWDPTIGSPISLSSGKPYRGINVWLLGLEAQVAGYSSPYWGTYKQITERGGQVRKGERSTLVVLWHRVETTKLDEATGKYEPHGYMMLRHFNVFNAEQADPAEGQTFRLPARAERTEFDPIEEAEVIFTGYSEREGSPEVVVGHDGAAWFSPSADRVSLPARSAFDSAEGFYSTAFHEFTHSTGAKSRLNREGVTEGHPFGSGMYAAEELIAEMGSALLCGHAGIDNTVEQSAAYIENWLGALRGDSRMVVKAAGKAQKAADLVLGVEPE